MLFKRAVSLTDAVEMKSNSILGSGFGSIQISANGIIDFPSSQTPQIPQQQIWNKYAAMFDFYQVKSVRIKFIPYKWEYPGTLPVSTTAYPTWTIIDPESVLPTSFLPGSYYSYGNCRDAKPYAEHHRSMRNYTDLGLSKQPTLILETGGSAGSRA
jgi:hypothetical protein